MGKVWRMERREGGREKRGAPGWWECWPHLFSSCSPHKTHLIPTHAPSTSCFNNTCMFSAFLPNCYHHQLPPPQCAGPHTFPPAACSQPAPLLKGRNHSFSLGFISLAIKCKGGSKIQHLLSAGDCMVQRSSVWVLEPDLWIRTLALPFKLYILGEVKKASVKISFCIH